ncbi:hypothetical protein F4824DRAFT_505064 [Ustulina deusta]|nr:hypothetical protein F4824DRAFT_506481 [Ustulina deusta]KAI3330569.1 hypothetical protein F4824DRAFT_505064 [Ustulina deusta]
MHPTLASEGECTMFAAFDKISEDGKAGFYYFKLFTSQEQLTAFASALERTESYTLRLLDLGHKFPGGGYRSPGFWLQRFSWTPASFPVRGEAGVCAFTDASQLSRALACVREVEAKELNLEEPITEFRDETLGCGAWGIEVSNPILEDTGELSIIYLAHSGRKRSQC